MKEHEIYDAIGELPEDLLVPVEVLRQKKRYPIMKWTAIAACLCLLLGLPLAGKLMDDGAIGGLKAESVLEAPQENKYGAVADSINAAIFRGKVLEVHEKYVLVQPLEGENELLCSDKIEVSLWKLEQVPEIAEGQILEIIYDGMIQETYPARITGTSNIRIVE